MKTEADLNSTKGGSVPRTMVLTGVGRDRVGIVAELTDRLYKLGCNMLDSSMTLLRGEFALILMVELPENLSPQALDDSLREVQQGMGLMLHMRELSAQELQEQPAQGNPHMISVYGADKPGIVAGITRRLAELGINITDVETKSTSEGEENVFVMILEVNVPAELPTRAVESALDETSRALGVDMSVQPIEVYDL
jgi:glycine cleavage system transcriptional repressor